MASVKIHLQLDCTVREDKQTDCYVGHCPALDVFSAGNTELEALESIRSALSMYVVSLYKHNRLDEKLLTTGFFPVGELRPSPPRKDQYVAVEDGGAAKQYIVVDVPVLLQMSESGSELVHA
jgi:predicted RNase H-like HicB family nuclease